MPTFIIEADFVLRVSRTVSAPDAAAAIQAATSPKIAPHKAADARFDVGWAGRLLDTVEAP